MDSNISDSPETLLEPTVSEAFIEQNKKVNLVRPRQKFAPWTKGQRRKRRQEVFRLHFSEGMTALAIAELMKVDRNTINQDINWLYSKMAADIEGKEFDGYFAKQLVRLETQRSRITSYLSEANDLEKKLAVERQLAEMDFRLAAMMEKFKENTFAFWDEVAKKINELAESQGLDGRYTTVYELQKIPVAKRRMIDRAFEEQGGAKK